MKYFLLFLNPLLLINIAWGGETDNTEHKKHCRKNSASQHDLSELLRPKLEERFTEHERLSQPLSTQLEDIGKGLRKILDDQEEAEEKVRYYTGLLESIHQFPSTPLTKEQERLQNELNKWGNKCKQASKAYDDIISIMKESKKNSFKDILSRFEDA